jgi:hypothetical protein
MDAEPAAIVVPEREPPAQPFRGIAPFRFLDQPIFFGRLAESQRLLRLVTMFRGVLLYGDSGAGKSSLLNARFIPEAIADGFLPERIRIQPKPGAEIVLDRIAVRERGLPPFLPSNLVRDAETPRAIFSCDQLREQISRADVQGYPLLVFDQFEEFVTLFEVAPRTPQEREQAKEAQTQLLELLVHFLVASHAPVKLLFAFREDYFTKLQKLFARCRDLMDQSLRLLPPSVDDLPLAIRGPFEKNPGMFANPLAPAVCEQLETELRARSSAGLQNPSEVQIAGLMLWLAKDPAELLARRKVQGLLEDYLVQQLEALSPAERAPAVALLSCLVTEAGTRNIVSRSDLIERVTESESVTEEAAAASLDTLVQKTGLVRQEFREEAAFYQIISEFLVPWIRAQKAERARLEAIEHERAEAEQQREEAEKRYLAARVRRLWWSFAVLSLLMVLLLAGWVTAAKQWKNADRERQAARKAEQTARDAEAAARSAEDATRTALEQNARTANAAESRLFEAAKAFSGMQVEVSKLLQQLEEMKPAAGAEGSESWTKLVDQVGAVVAGAGAASEQFMASAQVTQKEASSAKATPGWSLYGKLTNDDSWQERYFHHDGARGSMPAVGETVTADTFVNVRRRPNAYDAERKEWIMEQIVGVIGPKQRIKVEEVHREPGSPDDPLVRFWIRGEPGTP